MKRFAMFLLCAALTCFTTAVFAQDQFPDPGPESNLPSLDVPANGPIDGTSVAAGVFVTGKNASANGTGIALWSYQITSPVDGKTYTGVMVGRSPLVRGARTTSIPITVIPVRTISPSGFVFDPTQPDAGCYGNATPMDLVLQSPILNNTPAPLIMNGVNVGATQYVDAFRRAEFWTPVSTSGGAYHTTLGPITVAPLQTLSTTKTTEMGSFTFTGQTTCGNNTTGALNRKNVFNIADINFVDKFLEQALIDAQVPATNFALYIIYGTVISTAAAGPPGGCCVLGYHSDNDDTQPNLITTYGIAEFDRGKPFGGTSDTSVLAHEVSEWMDDPFGINPTPSWGHVGQVSGCQGNLETGDPLSGKLFPPVTMPNGFTYNLQELAYFSWFFRQNPSLGTAGKFSNNGTFTTDAGPVCH